MITAKLPLTMGTPEMMPLTGSKFRPVGRALAPKIAGSLLAVMVYANGCPCLPPNNSGLVMPGTSVTRVSASCPVAVAAALVANTARLKMSDTAGMPEMIPVTGSLVRPVGNPWTPNVSGRLPVAVLVNVKKWPCCPTALFVLVMVGGTRTVSSAFELVTSPTMFEMDTA